tara:strand:+ start:400 stop:2679 length:2280 start_codon:yes stop_codon:yes gene_type:complete
MIEQGLIQKHFLGRDGFIWWIGQIVDQTQWAGNFPGHPTSTTEEQKGFGFRYKVRIMGYHTASQSDLPNEDLPWASVLLPVTAGVSGGGMSTPNLRGGDFVQGFFMDGEDAQQPVIMGVLGYNQYTDILKNPPEDVSFVPFSGFTDLVPQYSLPLKENQTTEAKSEEVKTKSDSNYKDVMDSTIRAQTTDSGADKEQDKTESKKSTITEETKCEPVPIGPIQTKVKNMIADVEEIKKTANDWETMVSTKIYNMQEEIDKVINNATRNISSDVKTITQGIQENALKQVNNTLSDTFDNVFPSQLGELRNKVEEANDEVSCAFKNIMKNLTGMVGGFLKDIIDKVINAAECLINNFIGSLLGKITGLIDSAVGAALAPIKSLLSGMGSATGALDDVIGFSTNALSFLSCDEDPNCSNVKDWNPTDGPQIKATLDLQSIFGKAKSAADSVKDAVSGFANLGDAISGIAKGADFSDVFENSCNVGPLFCGPPTIEFFGGGGSGATGNAIISVAGTLLGVDIITPGGDYIGPPRVKFNDSCNKGRGATGRAVVEDGKVVQVIMDDTGTGYLPVPDGSQGGDGRTWADKDRTTVRRSDNTYDPPYKPGTVITVCPGDEVTYPGGNSVIITGDDCQDITAPPLDDTTKGGPFPSTGTGDYPIVLELDSINVTNPGFGYDCSKDKVIMQPSHGCEFKLMCDSLGSIIRVDVVKGCIGFNEDPDIYIQSDTGYNARMMPVFKVNRVEGEQQLVSSGELIQVVDCVGKV